MFVLIGDSLRVAHIQWVVLATVLLATAVQSADQDNDDDDDGMLAFAYFAFALGGLLLLVCMFLICLWWRNTRKDNADRRHLLQKMQAYTKDPWLRANTMRHEVITNPAASQTMVDVDVTEFNDFDEPHDSHDIRRRQEFAAERLESQLYVEPQPPRPLVFTPTDNKEVNIAVIAEEDESADHVTGLVAANGVVYDSSSGESSGATHTSTSPMIPNKKEVTVARARSSVSFSRQESETIPYIVAPLEPEGAHSSGRTSNAYDNNLATAEALAALEEATSHNDVDAFRVDSAFMDPVYQDSDFSQRMYHTMDHTDNHHGRHLDRHTSQDDPLYSSVHSRSTLPMARVRNNVDGTEAMAADSEVVYNVTLTVH